MAFPASSQAAGPGTAGLSERACGILRLPSDGRVLGNVAGAPGLSYKTAAITSSKVKATLRVTGTADLVRLSSELETR